MLALPPSHRLLALARRGDAVALRQLLRSAPDVLASETHAAQLLHLAVLHGRASTVELLLESGLTVNMPAPIAALILVTPLCAARLKRHKDIEAMLLQRGACEDVFTHAFLGDIERLEADLNADPALAQGTDPAVDVLAITPVHHQNVDLVSLLLQRGANARWIAAGRWVLHPQLAAMLSRGGAQIDRSGAWIGLACTGNQGRKDDPDLVAALLRHGARVDDRRQIGQHNDGGRATALHYATKAGFVKTIGVLLAHGADPSARDDNGLTPLDWLERSAKSVDRQRVRALLAARPVPPDAPASATPP